MRDRLRIAEIGAPVEVFRAFDAAEISEPMLADLGVGVFRGWKQPGSKVSYHARDIKLGEIGCSLSHWMIWRRIVDEGMRAALILEDDVELAPRFGQVLAERLAELYEVSPIWHLCYVGRKRITVPPFTTAPPPPEEALAENLVVPSFSYCTHAYVVSSRGAEVLLGQGFERNILPVDEFVPALYTHHPRSDVRALFGDGDRLRAAAIVPDLAVQAGEGSDTEGSSLALTTPAPVRYGWASAARKILRRRRKAGPVHVLQVETGGDLLEFPIAAELLGLVRWLCAQEEMSMAELRRGCPEAPEDLRRGVVGYLLQSGALVRRPDAGTGRGG